IFSSFNQHFYSFISFPLTGGFMKFFLRSISLLLLLLLGTALFAQETGQVFGTVTDPTGAIVPTAKLTITNINTNAARAAEVGATGQYALTNLIPGTYELKVEATGFALYKQRIEVTVGSRITTDVHLQVSSAPGTVVEVSAEGNTAVAVDTSSQT